MVAIIPLPTASNWPLTDPPNEVQVGLDIVAAFADRHEKTVANKAALDALTGAFEGMIVRVTAETSDYKRWGGVWRLWNTPVVDPISNVGGNWAKTSVVCSIRAGVVTLAMTLDKLTAWSNDEAFLTLIASWRPTADIFAAGYAGNGGAPGAVPLTLLTNGNFSAWGQTGGNRRVAFTVSYPLY